MNRKKAATPNRITISPVTTSFAMTMSLDKRCVFLQRSQLFWLEHPSATKTRSTYNSNQYVLSSISSSASIM
eukprot:scaffold8377_cov58-Phaeocystis_antarctica.AAC.3